ncbi:hypothetical protein C2S52_009680 [Perilla frutescens var. hirtella]|nr:hypothetical protein C2S51_016837 [Perilla frutescens var. frutescens]KAH6784721.1 hypothetical protein C2S52_009680 [Perilla frutescens var. hirtella]
MNHRKIRSQGYVPFSWEEKPGIPKSSSDVGMMRGFDHDHMSENLIGGGSDVRAEVTIIAPPPPCTLRKSRWRDDPFLAALKYCSKGNHDDHHHVFKEKMMSLSKISFFSCKHSCNVVNDNFVNFSKLPHIPKESFTATGTAMPQSHPRHNNSYKSE